MLNKKISIIVPVYNAERYIERTIQALINQSYKNLEIILVDNNSIDKSLEICEKYAELDSRIQITSENISGPSAARNKGINFATGDFICFCDSDDLPDENMYETLLKYIIDLKSDITMCEFYSERIDDILELPYEDKCILEREEILNDLIPKMIGNKSDEEKNIPIWGSVWRCIYKKSIIQEMNLKFNEDIKFAEDLIFTLSYLKNSQSVSICKKPLYYYRMNEESIMFSSLKYENEKFNKRKILYESIKQVLIDINKYEQIKDRLLVTYRLYIIECIGNSYRRIGKNSLFEAYKEVKYILNEETVESAFEKFNCISLKKKILYTLVKKKSALLLSIYFKIRFILSNKK